MSNPEHDERWAAWVAKGAIADARTHAQMRILLAILFVAALVVLATTLG
jgi:hypothetical protein